MSRAETLVLGIGNPILADDAVGLVVARAVHARLAPGQADLVEASVGGLELLDVLEGRRRVLILDALDADLAAPGELVEWEVIDAGRAPLGPHHAGLTHCVAFGKACGLAMPEEILVLGIGVRDARTFSESLTQEVGARVPEIVASVAAMVFGPGGRFS